MIKPINFYFRLILFVSLFLPCTVNPDPKNQINFYNWSDYIGPNTLKQFSDQTQIKVNYQVFDSNEQLESILLAGKTGFDLVVPSAFFMPRHIKADIYQPLDWKQIPNKRNLDPMLMRYLQSYDPGNRFAVPYLWGTTGIGLNAPEIHQRLPQYKPSWSLLFSLENVKKLSSCGIALLDEPTVVIPILLTYLQADLARYDYDYIIGKVNPILKSIRPYIRYFHSSQYIQDLANEDICIAMGYSGDILQAQQAALQNKILSKVDYVIPQEGAPIWFDVLAIPKSSKQVKQAHQLINYLLDPEVSASITKEVMYPSAVLASEQFLPLSIRTHAAIFPDPVKHHLFHYPVYPENLEQKLNRFWLRYKALKSK